MFEVAATSGCFDLFHAGHVDLLKRCRCLADYVVVALNTDASVRRLKGDRRPIQPYGDRRDVLLACRYVDRVVPLEDGAPMAWIASVKPDYWVKGAPYSIETLPEASLVASYGGQVVIVPSRAISTSQLVVRCQL